jgi:hypothetical protein
MEKEEKITKAETKPKPAIKPATEPAKKTEQDKIMEQLKVTTLFENSKGEFFTSLNLAVLSEGGNSDRVITHKAK